MSQMPMGLARALQGSSRLRATGNCARSRELLSLSVSRRRTTALRRSGRRRWRRRPEGLPARAGDPRRPRGSPAEGGTGSPQAPASERAIALAQLLATAATRRDAQTPPRTQRSRFPILAIEPKICARPQADGGTLSEWSSRRGRRSWPARRSRLAAPNNAAASLMVSSLAGCNAGLRSVVALALLGPAALADAERVQLESRQRCRASADHVRGHFDDALVAHALNAADRVEELGSELRLTPCVLASITRRGCPFQTLFTPR